LLIFVFDEASRMRDGRRDAVKKMLELRALQTLKGDDAAIAEILRALRKTKGKACALLKVGKSSMYRLIEDLHAEAAIDALIRELNPKVQGKVLSDAPSAPTEAGPRLRVKRAAA
jgi:hypothetical protein